MRTRVRSQALLSGLGIQHCHELWCSLQMRLGSHIVAAAGSNLTPSWEVPGAALNKAGKKKKKKAGTGVPTVAQWVKDPTCLCRGSSLIHSPVQWVKDPTLLLLWHGSSSSLDLIPSLGTSMCHGDSRKRKKKKKKKEAGTWSREKGGTGEVLGQLCSL